MCFPTIGCTKKIRKALAKIVVAKRTAEGDDMGRVRCASSGYVGRLDRFLELVLAPI
jgi:hypothetical protein